MAGDKQSFDAACKDLLRFESAKPNNKATVENISAVYADFAEHRKEREDG